MAPEKVSLDALRIDRSGNDQPKRRLLPVLVVIVVLFGVAAAAWTFVNSQAVEVRTATARALDAGGARTLLNASGYVVARREATVSSKVTGKVVEVLIEEGLKVETGQVLARLDDSNLQASLQLAQARLEAAKAALAETAVRLDEAERELRRIRDLAASKVASEAELDQARAAAESLRARLGSQRTEVTVAEKELSVWQQQLDDTIIRAPFAGIVTVKSAQPGEMISPVSAGGGFTRTGICTIVDMASLEIEVDVNESYINRVTASQPVEATLDAYPGWRIPAKVIAIIPTADRQKATVKVRIGFEKLDSRLLPQMGVMVAFRSLGEAPAGERLVAIPKAAVFKQNGQDAVLLMKNGRAELRLVQLGVTQQEETTVLSGCAGGEKLIVERPKNLKPGGRVRESRR
jgi:RND family efflux transporter MFP subunit